LLLYIFTAILNVSEPLLSIILSTNIKKGLYYLIRNLHFLVKQSVSICPEIMWVGETQKRPSPKHSWEKSERCRSTGCTCPCI